MRGSAVLARVARPVAPGTAQARRLARVRPRIRRPGPVPGREPSGSGTGSGAAPAWLYGGSHDSHRSWDSIEGAGPACRPASLGRKQVRPIGRRAGRPGRQVPVRNGRRGPAAVVAATSVSPSAARARPGRAAPRCEPATGAPAIRGHRAFRACWSRPRAGPGACSQGSSRASLPRAGLPRAGLRRAGSAAVPVLLAGQPPASRTARVPAGQHRPSNPGTRCTAGEPATRNAVSRPEPMGHPARPAPTAPPARPASPARPAGPGPAAPEGRLPPTARCGPFWCPRLSGPVLCPRLPRPVRVSTALRVRSVSTAPEARSVSTALRGPFWCPRLPGPVRCPRLLGPAFRPGRLRLLRLRRSRRRPGVLGPGLRARGQWPRILRGGQRPEILARRLRPVRPEARIPGAPGQRRRTAAATACRARAARHPFRADLLAVTQPVGRAPPPPFSAPFAGRSGEKEFSGCRIRILPRLIGYPPARDHEKNRWAVHSFPRGHVWAFVIIPRPCRYIADSLAGLPAGGPAECRFAGWTKRFPGFPHTSFKTTGVVPERGARSWAASGGLVQRACVRPWAACRPGLAALLRSPVPGGESGTGRPGSCAADGEDAERNLPASWAA